VQVVGTREEARLRPTRQRAPGSLAIPDKEFATVLDLNGNVHEFGPPEAERSFSLKKGIELVSSEERAVEHQPRGIIRTVETGEALIAFDALSPKLRENALEQLTQTAIMCGYKPGWVWHRFKERFGTEIPLLRYTSIKRRIENSPRCFSGTRVYGPSRIVTGKLSF
jgi:hypothetical protein